MKNTTYELQHLIKYSQLTKIFPMAMISTFTLYDMEGKGCGWTVKKYFKIREKRLFLP